MGDHVPTFKGTKFLRKPNPEERQILDTERRRFVEAWDRRDENEMASAYMTLRKVVDELVTEEAKGFSLGQIRWHTYLRNRGMRKQSDGNA